MKVIVQAPRSYRPKNEGTRQLSICNSNQHCKSTFLRIYDRRSGDFPSADAKQFQVKWLSLYTLIQQFQEYKDEITFPIHGKSEVVRFMVHLKPADLKVRTWGLLYKIIELLIRQPEVSISPSYQPSYVITRLH